MELSCCIWALSESPGNALEQVSFAGFKSIDVCPGFLDTYEQIVRSQALELDVSCFGASFGLPDGISLDHEETFLRSQAVSYLEQGIQTSGELGANTVYVVPDKSEDRRNLSRYAHSLTLAADQAAAFGVKLCVEHFPGSALSTALGTIQYLRNIDHPNLFLLLDLGHLQISDENPAAIIDAAGSLLGYVHLDDNDGKDDLHLPLCDGILNLETLETTFQALYDNEYVGNVSLELSPNLDDPLDGLIRSRRVVEEFLNR
ncbi:MAG: D-psicose 3-epimerase [Candidatus Moanabacter tarae]|uniref:D-psicose 3-epimerase n=1 Tax=Candidatus Moanibacter tarae TaxID=2200854 RepID=A0A2Z4AAT5_9BACT|nr:MAG: D-psicose 3-epimerase [Candidatus Moanabacter tarae]|tara:strand:+ start:32927 stop:33703 length:777 start_codon:yes stop_codon:yes gene_type:complete